MCQVLLNFMWTHLTLQPWKVITIVIPHWINTNFPKVWQLVKKPDNYIMENAVFLSLHLLFYPYFAGALDPIGSSS